MEFERASSLVAIITGIALAACSSTSTSKGGGGPDGGGAGGSGNAGAAGGSAGASGAAGSSGVGGAGGSAPGAACETICDAIGAASCPNEQPYAECVSDCSMSSNGCAAELDAFAGCVSMQGTVVCDDIGDPTLNGCDPSLSRLSACSACIPDSADDACNSCQKTNCCPQLKAFVGSPDVFDFSECILACTTQACFTNCETQFPIAGSASDALTRCIETSCLTPCSAP